MSPQAVIVVGVGLYIAVMLAVGVYASRKTHTVTEFIVAGRGLSLPICAATLVATWFGGGSMMGVSGAAYQHGMLGVIADPLGAALALFLVGFFFARLFRRLRILTTADFMQQRYGTVPAVTLVVTTVISNIMWVGAMLVAFGLIFESLTGTPMAVGIVGGAVVIMVYTSVGGLWAVALTDFLQMMIIIVGLVMLLTVVLIDVGGWGAIASQLPAGTFRLIPREHTGELWLNYLRLWVILGVADVASQSLIQRALAARDERTAQYAFYVSSVGYLIFGMIPVFLGIIASVTMPGLEDPEAVIPALALAHLHPVAIAVFVGALLAAIMSSADSALLACGSLVAQNILPHVVRAPSTRVGLIVARTSIFVFGALAVAIAMRFQVVLDLILDGNALGLAVVVVPFIVGVWWRKANRTGALAAMGTGLVTWLVTMAAAPTLPADLIGLGTSLVVMLVVTASTQRFDPPRPLTDSEGNPVAMRDRLGTIGWRDRRGRRGL